MGSVGIIANPAAGKDIRRLVVHASTFDHLEKVNIARRVLLGLAAADVDEVLWMPDAFGIVTRALQHLDGAPAGTALDFEPTFTHADSTRAAAVLRERGVGCIVTLGGDGTNRAVAKGCGHVPLVAISTGTNKVFPRLMEGTVAGLAAGAVASGMLDVAAITRPTLCLEILRDGRPVDLALVDVAVCSDRFVGARAVWDPGAMRQAVTTTARSDVTGLSSIAVSCQACTCGPIRAWRWRSAAAARACSHRLRRGWCSPSRSHHTGGWQSARWSTWSARAACWPWTVSARSPSTRRAASRAAERSWSAGGRSRSSPSPVGGARAVRCGEQPSTRRSRAARPRGLSRRGGVVELTHEQLIEMYRRMLRIRLFDEQVVELATRGELPGAAHTSIGQEATVVGACMALRTDDYMVGTHRSHGHPIGKGADLKRLFAELLGKETGVNRGKGGSMHLADFSVGSVGETSIVGSGLPVAAGAALGAQVLGQDRVALCFFGDGASNEGAFHEALNLAAVWRLPAVFVCENNGYAVTMPAARACAVKDIAARAQAYEMPGVAVDGQDPIAVYEAVSQAVARARSGGGPSLIEAKTYRYREHAEGFGGDVLYRTDDEVASWRKRDPVTTFRAQLIEQGIMSASDVERLEASVRREVADGLEFARQSPYPAPQEAFDGLYATPLQAASATV